MGGAGYAGTIGDWREACGALPKSADAKTARSFFESRFVPYRVSEGANGENGLFTGYYEPEVRASRTAKGAYRTPLYGLPSDLVSVDLGLFRDTLRGQRLAGRVENGKLLPYATRADIDKAGLRTAKPIFFIDDPIDAFFLEIQGSGRVRLDDGSVVRAVYAASNGQPYTAIGAVLIEQGEMTREDVSLPAIRAWLVAHPDRANALLQKNAAYVFFSEKPLGDAKLGAEGAAGVPLTPVGSLAVDRSVHALGVPVWLETAAPDSDPTKPDAAFAHLLIAQDTGGAIKGAVRGDVYWGVGKNAESIAGRMKHPGTLTVFVPKALAARLGADPSFTHPTS